MKRVLVAAVALAGLPFGARADEPAVRLTVRPMAAPRPALKYQLLPEVGELLPGNAAQNYLKCFMEQRNFFYGKEAVTERARYQTVPLAELPAGKLRNYGGMALRQADWAARQDTVDWQTLSRVQNGGPDALPGELGPLQILAQALHVRFRAEVAGRHFDDALVTAKTMFAMARHLGEHPTPVANLVGLWVAHQGLATLEEMVQQPGCPNLYWALTDLPCPLVDLRKGVQGDRALVAVDLRPLRDDAPLTDAELEKVVSHLSGVMSFAREQAGRPPRSLRAAVRARVDDPERVQSARRRLVEEGGAEELVAKFSALQVILLEAKHDYEVGRDERAKLLALPLWQIDARAAEGPGDGLFADLLPDVVHLCRSQGRLRQQIALLRHVEALRLYAAGHDGRLPESLADLPVPPPLDPVSGRPFEYAREGETAHLRGAGLPEASSEVHYAVIVRK